MKKVGHGGTLDPAATGVLPMALGRATRLLPYLADDKAYRAVVRFGVTTSTNDLEGEILTRVPVPDLRLEMVQRVLPNFQGTIEQVPPAHSAIQVQGQRLYHLARQGKSVTPPPRTVTVHHIQVQGWQPGAYPEITLLIDCGAGTYIRSVARDLGKTLGCGATLAGLTRTRSSGFVLGDSLTLEAVKAELDQGHLDLVPVPLALAHLPAVELDDDQARRWCQGQKFAPPVALTPDRPYRVLDHQGNFLGIGQQLEYQGGVILKAKMVFRQD